MLVARQMRAVTAAGHRLRGAIPVMVLGFDPFSTPVIHAERLRWLAEAGAIVAVVIDKKSGRRAEYHSANDNASGVIGVLEPARVLAQL